MRTRTRITLAGLVLGAALIGGVAWATIPDAAGVYTACKNAAGTIRLIDPSLPSTSLLGHCTTYETQITWNQKGSKGDTGAAGANGTNGAKGDTGAAGTDGTDGINGINGTNGADGAKGEPCLPSIPACVGPKGDMGLPGAAGAQGPKGDKGDPGTGVQVYLRKLPVGSSSDPNVLFFSLPGIGIFEINCFSTTGGIRATWRYQNTSGEYRGLFYPTNSSAGTQYFDKGLNTDFEKDFAGGLAQSLTISLAASSPAPTPTSPYAEIAMTGIADSGECTFTARVLTRN